MMTNYLFLNEETTSDQDETLEYRYKFAVHCTERINILAILKFLKIQSNILIVMW